MVKRLLANLVLAFIASVWGLAALAIAPIESDGTTAILAGANTIFLDNGTGTKGHYSHITIWLSPSSSSMYFTFNQGVTASSSNALLASGAGYSNGLAGFSAATNQLNYFGNGTTGTISWVAY
jgi:hypothetical protein